MLAIFLTRHEDKNLKCQSLLAAFLKIERNHFYWYN
jgi:hypothetical protein